MQNRLATVRETQGTHQAQLQEVRVTIEAEKAARPESARTILFICSALLLTSQQIERASALTTLAAQKQELEELEKELLKTFQKVEVNIPLLNTIRQVPRYAKFLKELCTSKKKLKGNEVLSVGENVSVIIQCKLSQKCKDPSTFTIPYTIGNQRIECAMLDLGASINVMPHSVYASLKLGPLKQTGVIIQLAD